MPSADAATPFRIDVPDAVLADLRRRLHRTRLPDQLPGSSWELGTDRDELAAFLGWWADEFDWRSVEAALNRFDHAVTTIDGQRIHWAERRSPRPDATPLLLLSGWPSTFAEFAGVMDPLADPDAHGAPGAPAFHVLAPSLPGFGFSTPCGTGWTPRRIAGAIRDLMARLGHERYVAHGGDWGAMVCSQLGLLDAAHCRAIHLGMVIAPKPAGFDLATLDDDERADVARMHAVGREEMGYQQIQGTRPDALSIGLHDSPAGLAAWILEKFRAWSDCGGDVWSRFTREQLATTLTLYWATGTIASANRIYKETRLAGAGASLPDRRVPVPLGYTRFPGDGFRPPRAWVEALYDVAWWSTVDEGGHFPAFEVPAVLVAELRRFFGPGGPVPA